MQNERARAMHKLLLPEDYREAHMAMWGDDRNYEYAVRPEPDGKRARLLRMHETNRQYQLEKLDKLFKHDFDDSKFEIVEIIPCMYQGWECDEWAYMVKYKGKKYIIATGHGALYFMKKKEMLKLIATYRNATKMTLRAMKFAGMK